MKLPIVSGVEKYFVNEEDGLRPYLADALSISTLRSSNNPNVDFSCFQHKLVEYGLAIENYLYGHAETNDPKKLEAHIHKLHYTMHSIAREAEQRLGILRSPVHTWGSIHGELALQQYTRRAMPWKEQLPHIPKGLRPYSHARHH
jgi:hypothetical protein